MSSGRDEEGGGGGGVGRDRIQGSLLEVGESGDGGQGLWVTLLDRHSRIAAVVFVVVVAVVIVGRLSNIGSGGG